MRNSIIEKDLKDICNYNLPWHKFYGKTVLVTGAAGMLPAYLVESLLYLNESKAKPKIKVLGLVRNKSGAQKRFSFYKGRQDLKFIIADVSERFTIPGTLDYIIHAASQASPKFYGNDPVGTLLPNTLGTYNILELARKKKTTSILFFSSSEIYGHTGSRQLTLAEHDIGRMDPTELRSCYPESKRLGETMCVSWWHQYGVPAKIVRPFHTYGPGMKLDDGRVFADFVANIVRNQNIVLNSDGKAKRAFCYISDAAKAFFTVLLKGENGQAYNVANDKAKISIVGLAQTIVGLFPEKGLKVVKKGLVKKGYIKSSVGEIFPDIGKIARLGWQPKISIKEGFKKTINSFLWD